MARRKEFSTIADGLVRSFVSRNNDVNGYWGIGKLYSHIVTTGVEELKIHLLRRSIEPDNEEFKLLINEFANRLNNQIENRRLNHNFLKKAELVIIGIPDVPTTHLGRIAPNKVKCRLVIVDDLNREHVGEASTWCRAHNPENESKSGREYN